MSSSQKGRSGKNLIQAGRDYVRFIQVNIAAGNWSIVLFNFLLICSLLYLLADGTKWIADLTLQELPEPTPSPSPTTSDCVITVTHPFAQFSERPSHKARVLGRVETGKYKVLDNKLVTWVRREEMWYQIQYNDKLGWINDSPIIIGTKTNSCP